MDDTDARLVDSLVRLTKLSSDDNRLAQHDDELPVLIEELFAELGLTMPLSRSGGRGSASGVIRFRDEGQRLLGASRTLGPDEAIRRLREFAQANESSYSEVLLFWGMHPPIMVEIVDGIELGPLDALPPSDPQAYFLGTSLDDSERSSPEYVHHFPKPSAVLVKHTVEKPIYFHQGDARREWTYEDKHFLTDLMHVIPIVIRSPVIRISEWHRWEPDAPVVSLGGEWGSVSHARLARPSQDIIR